MVRSAFVDPVKFVYCAQIPAVELLIFCESPFKTTLPTLLSAVLVALEAQVNWAWLVVVNPITSNEEMINLFIINSLTLVKLLYYETIVCLK